MPDKLTDKEIVKALEKEIQDSKRINSSYALLNLNLLKETVDLINRLQEENERLKNAIATLSANAVGFAEEIDRHVKDKNNAFELAANIVEAEKIVISEAKAEAYKEFAERLKKHCYFDHKDQRNVVAEIIIDHYLKELVGEDK